MEIYGNNLNGDLNNSPNKMETNAATLSQPDEKCNKSVENSCRLCLKELDEMQMDIFMKPMDENNMETSSLADRLYDLLQVKFENKSPLPQGICERCFLLFEAFSEFRANVLKCETELQKHYNDLQLKYRESAKIQGLNGNAGEFLANEDFEVIEVNVEQDYESSEDDFSMESDTEAEENAIENKTLTNNNNENHNSTTVQSTNQFPPLTMQHGENSGTKTLCFLCQYCDMPFTTQSECHEHENQAHDNVYPYTCNFCQARHTNRQSIIAHIRQTHQPDRPYICPLCAKGFCRRSDLKKHTIVHTGVRPYSCTICSKSFSRNTNLTKHMRIHNSTRPHVCQICPRSFMTAPELAQHVMSHSEAKSFACDQCPATYTRRDKLNIHKFTHIRQEAGQQYKQLQQLNNNFVAQITAQQPDPLNEFSYQQHKSILATHLLQQQQQQRATQAKQRSYNCDSCSKTFTREQDLQRHNALHLDHLFKCKACDIGFARKEKLMLHIQEKHAPLYNCDLCNISFSQAESLNMHLKVHQLQQFATYSAQTALNVVNNNLNANNASIVNHDTVPPKQLTADEMSFYSQMVPTMNLGFYSETRPEA